METKEPVTGHPLAVTPATDPSQILRYRDRQYAAELIAVAMLEFDLFSWMSRHPGATFETLCESLGFVERPADVMLTLCRASGFIYSARDGGLHLTDMGREYLCGGSAYFLGPYYKPIAATPIARSFREVLTTGKPANWQGKSDGADWHASMRDPVFAADFTNLMNCRGLAFGQVLAERLSPALASRSRLLDVAGGSGIYSATMIARNPHMTATVLEQAPVDAITRQEISRHGLDGQVQVLTADMFDATWPTQHDVLLFSNVLHDWDVAEVDILLQKAADALLDGGLLIIHDAFIDSDKAGPLPVAEYSALLMNITQGKCYSVGEYEDMLRTRGFHPGEYQPTLADRGLLTAERSRR